MRFRPPRMFSAHPGSPNVVNNRTHYLHGEAIRSSKLTEEQVRSIYFEYHYYNRSVTSLAKEYQVSYAQINRIVKGRNWRWLTQKEYI